MPKISTGLGLGGERRRAVGIVSCPDCKAGDVPHGPHPSPILPEIVSKVAGAAAEKLLQSECFFHSLALLPD